MPSLPLALHQPLKYSSRGWLFLETTCESQVKGCVPRVCTIAPLGSSTETEAVVADSVSLPSYGKE